MRIIAGKHRGRVLKEFKGRDIRPTSDRCKEALFNIFQADIAGSRFLDLFSGTGNMGIEAISRGASEVVFVDNSKESLSLIKANLEMVKEKGVVIDLDALSFVKSTDKTFDIIFLDPPYALDVHDILEEIKTRNLLTENGVIIYEHGGNHVDFSGLKKIDERNYGIATIDIFGRQV